MNNCIFCKILKGEIPSSRVYENEHCYAFHDIHPQAPVHILVISKKHTPNIAEASEHDIDQVSECMKAIAHIAREQGLLESGFRLITNCGKDACQSVDHLHFHILGGKQLNDQMG